MFPCSLATRYAPPLVPHDMIPDVPFEADFLRTALHLGVVREPDVREWADALLTLGAEPVSLLADVALAPPELTALREALRPLAASSPHASVGSAVLSFLATDPAAIALATADRIRVLGQLRREDILDRAFAEPIKAFEDRSMLASAGIGTDPAIALDVDDWLASLCAARYYRLSLAHLEERAALLAALSRNVVRDRRASASRGRVSQAWLVDATRGAGPTLVLNEVLWHIAVTEFSPLPLASRIPYAAIPAEAVLVLDEVTAEPMGAREATALLAAV